MKLTQPVRTKKEKIELDFFLIKNEIPQKFNEPLAGKEFHVVH